MMEQINRQPDSLAAASGVLGTSDLDVVAAAQVATRRGAGLYPALRAAWQNGIPCASEIHFAMGASLLWAVFYNPRFWELTLHAMWQPAPGSVGFLVSLFVLLLALQAILLLLMPTRMLLRVAASVLFVVAAASSYFSSTFGAIMNKDMLRNVLQTDPAEIGGLITSSMLAHIVVLGLLPAALVWRVSLPRISWTARLKQRAAFIATALAICAAGLFACSANYAVFFREYKPIRFTLMPAAPVVSLAGVLRGERSHDPDQPLLNPAGNAQRVGFSHARPLVMFVAVGETARAENFQLGGYARATNPQLETIDNLVYFNQTTSCGTSTALSVPCMFSHLGRTQFDADTAGRYTNLIDSLQQAGLDVEWRDNNAGCKGVCARVAKIDYSSRPDDELCPQSYCYDAVMLTDLAARLEHVQRDTVIVFHQIGSHGPAYFERYPPQFERFKPACHSNQLHNCTAQEIVNAYDNTIAYTDYILARQIALLQEASDHVDGVLIYASDHGESLGEQGIYLHGMPYGFAPKSQKQVPMLLWTSPGYDSRVGMRAGCAGKRAGEAFSHDNLYHTILGAAEVRNRAYDENLDILAACRRESAVFDHE
jgi:lipid A ethanolaminephosphotransferase